MRAEQRDRCATCGSQNPQHVDHDHGTGKVRGLLCFTCNQALGNVRDDPLVLLALAGYLFRSTLKHLDLTATEARSDDMYVEFALSQHRAA